MPTDAKPTAEACDHRWKSKGRHCTLDKGHPGADPDVHEEHDIRGRLIAMWVTDIDNLPKKRGRHG